MYTIGLIKTERPDVLINPEGCPTETAVYNWLERFFNPADFALDTPITEKAVAEILHSGKVGRINMNGYEVALLFGEDGVIQEATTRYLHLMPRSADNLDMNKIENLTIPE